MAAKTELFAQWMGGNLVVADQHFSTGKRLFVHSGTGTDSTGNGASPDAPLATIDYAVALCTASKGDVIYVMPGHAESLAAAGSLFDLSKAGVKVIGIGTGTLMPTFSLGHADATITVSAADCKISSVRIASSIANVKVGVTLSATSDGSIVEDCVFRDGGAAVEFLVAISVIAAANGCKILRNDFRTTAAAGSNNAILTAAVTDLQVIGNVAFGKYATGAMLGSAALVNALIADNIFVNAEADIGIALHTSSTGIFARNCLGGTTTLASTLTGDNAMWCFENYVSGAVAVSGALNPTADSD